MKKLADGTAIPGMSYTYGFDDIGNRETASSALSPANAGTYTSNALNQVTERTVPRLVDILATADSAATVTVNGDTMASTGETFLKVYDYSGTPNPDDAKYLNYDIEATLVGGEAAEASGNRFLPANPQPFSYDLDGNLLNDGRWAYTWNGENRLVAIETVALAYAAGAPRQKLEFAYDSQGRRFTKTVYEWNSSSGLWDVDYSTCFLYDGWNLIWEYITEEPISTEKTYAWGLDLSGSMQGAGGIGGLLQINKAQSGQAIRQAFLAYDGNGNVVATFDAQGIQISTYSYGPFGESIGFSGQTDFNSFRFSTKFWDAETQLAYYGFRFYSPGLGRWLSRDPIGEAGGLNLNGFVGNDGINRWDYLGLLFIDLGTQLVAKANVPSKGGPWLGSTALFKLREAGNDIVEEYQKTDGSGCAKYCAKVVQAKTIIVKVKSYLANDQLGIEYTSSGLAAIQGHEDRRRAAYEIGYQTYRGVKRGV